MKKQLLIVLCFFTLFLSAQNPANLDDAFSSVRDGSIDGNVATSAIQSDGRIIVGGNFTSYNPTTTSTTSFRIMRLNIDGTRDFSFNTGTGFDYDINSIAIQSDGKIIVGGAFGGFNGQYASKIIRLNTDGTRDTTFNIGAGFNGLGDFVNSIAIQSDGKIIIGGKFTIYNGIASNRIIRLNIDGTRDASFKNGGLNGGFDDVVKSIAIQSNGKIIVAGLFKYYNSSNFTPVTVANKIIRLNADGTNDSSFYLQAGFNNTVNSIAIQSDGKIITEGLFTTFEGIAVKKIIRLNTDGTRDSSFNLADGFNGVIESVTLQSDGKIFVGGSFSVQEYIIIGGVFTITFRGFNIIRLNTDGTTDKSFNTGIGFNNTVKSIKLQSDGNIFVGGNFTTFDGIIANAIIRLNTNATIDTSFCIKPGFNNAVNSIAIESSGNIIAGGNFTTFNGIAANGIIRLYPDGTKNSQFYIGTGFNGSIRSIVTQLDKKIIVGGCFPTFSGNTVNNIIRFNIDGTSDTSFITGAGFDGSFGFNGTNGSNASTGVYSMIVQSDGKIIAGGDFTTFQGITANGIIRLNTNGTRDTSFSIGTGFNSYVNAIAMQSDGKIIIGGNFTAFNGIITNRIIRLNTDGTSDTSFKVPYYGFNSDVNTIAIQSNGKIIIGGNFTTFDRIAANNITRLNTGGTRDTEFVKDIGFNGTVTSIAIQSNEKIIVGGVFSTLGGKIAKGIILLNPDGTSDSLFNSGVGFNNRINTIAIQPDGKIVIGGHFGNYMGIPVKTIVRLSGSPLLSVNKFPINKLSLYPNPAKEFLHLNLEDNSTPSYYEIYDLLGKSIKSAAVFENQIDINNLSNGLYILKVKTAKGTLTNKFLKE